MRFASCSYSPNFFAVEKPSALTPWLINFSKSSNKVFNEDSTWYVHYSMLVPLAKLAWEKLGSVDYSELPDPVKERIIIESKTWTRGQPPIQSAVSKLQKIEAYRRLYLVPDAPPDLVKAVYRHLAKVHHPDCGGDSKEFAELTEAFETIMRQ